jgi:hypothetical protein
MERQRYSFPTAESYIKVSAIRDNITTMPADYVVSAVDKDLSLGTCCDAPVALCSDNTYPLSDGDQWGSLAQRNLLKLSTFSNE